MRVWIYVEGQSDQIGLQTLFEACGWTTRLRSAGHGICVIALDSKSKFLRKVGGRVAACLSENDCDIAVGMPDLYPIETGPEAEYRHSNLRELQELQKRLVMECLEVDLSKPKALEAMERFYPCAFKHDFEMLLLAADRALASQISAANGLGDWRKPVEDQNNAKPPKRIVEEIFLRRSAARKAYRDTKDAPAVLRRVSNIRELFEEDHGQIKCPVFKSMIDWIGARTGIPC